MAGVVEDAKGGGKLKHRAQDGERTRAPAKMERRLPASAGCRAYMRRGLAKEFPGIVDGFVKAAKSGSIRHMRLVTEFLQPTGKGTTRVKGPVARFFEKLEQEKQERERLEAARSSGEGAVGEAEDVCVNR
jgi:hypothetical protein